MLEKVLNLLGLKRRKKEVVFDSQPRTEAEIHAGLVAALAQRAGVDRAGVDPTRTFAQLGFDSLQAMKFTGQLEKDLGLDLDPTLMWDHPTVERLTVFLAGQMGLAGDKRSIA